jgi:hypothetical protein
MIGLARFWYIEIFEINSVPLLGERIHHPWSSKIELRLSLDRGQQTLARLEHTQRYIDVYHQKTPLSWCHMLAEQS